MDRKLWLNPTILVLSSFCAFAIATFVMGVYFTHLHGAPLLLSIAMVTLYLYVIVASVLRVTMSLPFAATMLLIPIAPLAVLILVISFLPLWQRLL